MKCKGDTLYGESEMRMSTTDRLFISVGLGYVVIFNIIGTSFQNFYPTRILVSAALFVGFAMVLGSTYVLLRFDRKIMSRPIPHHQSTYATRRNVHAVPS